MTRVSDQAKRCGTAESIPVQSISATCPMSHFFFVETEQRVKGAHEPRGTIRKDAGHLGHGTAQPARAVMASYTQVKPWCLKQWSKAAGPCMPQRR